MRLRSLSRRSFLSLTGTTALATSISACSPRNLVELLAKNHDPVWVNDVQSKLNRTRVRSVFMPESAEELARYVQETAKRGEFISVAGTRHAMGTQQFATDARHIDMTGLNRIHGLDVERGILDCDSGTAWPAIMQYTAASKGPDGRPWSIIQKQTGANHFSMGGALASNVHGRGLNFRPIINDIESFDLVTAKGELLTCSRTQNADMFRLVIGGYGLFGIVTRVRLRLMPRERMQRVVEITTIDTLIPKVEQQVTNGFLYGDFQYITNPNSPGFLREGVFSSYRPVPYDTEETTAQHQALTPERWKHLYMLAHMDKAKAYKIYADYYQSTNGQLYWSDQQQLTTYLPPEQLPPVRRPDDTAAASLMITEIYVPRDRLVDYMETARTIARELKMDIIYGTIRMIRKDTESVLRWAKQDYACVIFNLRVQHDKAGIARAMEQFRALIDEAIAVDGSYYLTYHRWARRDQVLACYPGFQEFLSRKRQLDPAGLFQSDWYQHHRKLLVA